LASYDAQPIFCNATLPDDWVTKGGKQGAKASLARFATDCLETAEWPLNRVGDSMRKLIPADKVRQISDTVQIWASQINPLNYKARVASPMGPYSSKDDLITKIQASSGKKKKTPGSKLIFFSFIRLCRSLAFFYNKTF